MATQTVSAGDSIIDNSHGDSIRYDVGPKCHQNSGHWFCVTHDRHFANNLEYWSHCENVKCDHLVAWWCYLDGPEVP